MRKNKIDTFLLVLAVLTVLAGCQKQDGEPTPQPQSETVAVKFNTFLREGDHVRPLNLNTRIMAAEGTLANGFYLYGHAHQLSFTSSGNTYTTLFENVKINADGTYTIPKFWLENKALFYSFQAYAATAPLSKEVAPGPITVSGTPPYVSSIPAIEYLMQTDVLGAAVFDIKLGDETPTVNLYFEHRLAKLSLQMQRMNAGGPTLYNLRMQLISDSSPWYWQVSRLDWTPGKTITATRSLTLGKPYSDYFTLPASEMKPIEAHRFIFAPQTIPAGTIVTMTYTLGPEAVSASNPPMSLTTALPALTLESGKQLNVVIGHIVETDQIVVQSVTLDDWVTSDKDVPEYK